MYLSRSRIIGLLLTTATCLVACGQSSNSKNGSAADGGASSGASSGGGASGAGSGSGTSSQSSSSGSGAGSGGGLGSADASSGAAAPSIDSSATFMDAGCAFNTNACTQCESVHCCYDFNVCLSNPECGKWLTCAAGCGATAKCLATCNADYLPGAVQAEHFDQCQLSYCHNECGGIARE
jgi:hypothetical protein